MSQVLQFFSFNASGCKPALLLLDEPSNHSKNINWFSGIIYDKRYHSS